MYFKQNKAQNTSNYVQNSPLTLDVRTDRHMDVQCKTIISCHYTRPLIFLSPLRVKHCTEIVYQDNSLVLFLDKNFFVKSVLSNEHLRHQSSRSDPFFIKHNVDTFLISPSNIWAMLSEKVPSNNVQIQIILHMDHPGLCSLFIHFIVFNDSLADSLHHLHHQIFLLTCRYRGNIHISGPPSR